jgi:hypothetical protein
MKQKSIVPPAAPQDHADARFQEMRRRIRQRVAELGETPTTLAIRHGLGRDYIRDLIQDAPRKRSVRLKSLPALASALDVDEEYLTLKQEVPRRSGAVFGVASTMIRFGGFAEAGVWRSAPSTAGIPRLPVVSLPGAVIDVAYVQAGDGLAKLGIRGGMILYGESGAKAETGDVVVMRRRMAALFEIAARVKMTEGYGVFSESGEPVIDTPAMEYTEHVEAVIRIAQVGLFR